MHVRILGVLALVALVFAGLWMWLARGEHPVAVATVAPRPSEQQVEAASPSLDGNETRADVVRAPVQPVARIADAVEFALVNVLVVDKSTRKPLSHIEMLPHTESDGRHSYGDDHGLSRGKPWDTLRTDEDGRVVIEAPPLTVVWVQALGERNKWGAAATKVTAPAAGARTDIVLELPGADDLSFWVKLVDEDSNAPIAGVRIGSDATKNADRSTDLMTNALGLARFVGNSWSSEYLHIESETHGETNIVPGAGHEQAEDALLLPLPKCSTLRVHVTDAAGQAVADAKIDLTTEGYNLWHPRSPDHSNRWVQLADPHWQASTDASGTATIEHIPPRVAIKAGITRPRAWTSADKLVMEPGETRVVQWKLTSGCDVHGLVVDTGGSPVTKHGVWLCKATRRLPEYFRSTSNKEAIAAVTDDQGRFRFPEVSAGLWQLGPSAGKPGADIDPNEVAAFAQIIEVTAEQSDLDVTIRVDRGLFIRGRLLDPTGAPAPRGLLVAFDPVSKLSASTTALKKDGSFVLGPLMAGSYQLSAREMGPGANAPSDPMVVEAGAQGVELRFRPGILLSGRVLDQAGAPSAAKMWLVKRDSTALGLRGTSSQADGTFSFGGNDAGLYDFAASTTNGLAGVLEGVEVKDGEPRTDLEIRLVPAGRVRIRQDGPEQFANIKVMLHSAIVAADGIERGAAREFVSPAGTVVVRADYYESDSRKVERTVEVKAGETVDVVFEKGAH